MAASIATRRCGSLRRDAPAMRIGCIHAPMYGTRHNPHVTTVTGAPVGRIPQHPMSTCQFCQALELGAPAHDRRAGDSLVVSLRKAIPNAKPDLHPEGDRRPEFALGKRIS